MKTVRLLIAILLIIAILPAMAHSSDKNALGMVLDVRGKVRLDSPGQKTQNINPMASIFSGDTITSPKDGAITFITFSDNIEHTLTGAASVKITNTGIKKISGTVKSSRPKTGAVLPGNSRIGSRKLLGESLRNKRDFSFTSPVDSGAIMEGSHTFRWWFATPPPQVQFIVKDQKIWEESDVSDYDKLEKMSTVISQTVRGNSLTYPAPGQKPLEGGKTYLAYVLPITGRQNPADITPGAGDSPCSFRILSKSESTIIKICRKATDEAMKTNPGNPVPLMKMSRLYLEYGLINEALDSTLKLEGMMGDNPNVYWTLAHIYRQMGNTDEMNKAHRKAVLLEKQGR